jgi:hypothetical protein
MFVLLAEDIKDVFRSDQHGPEQPCNRSSTSTQTYRLIVILLLQTPMMLTRRRGQSVRRQLSSSCKKRGIHARHRLTQPARCRVYNVWKPAVVLRYIIFHARRRISITRPCKPFACVQVLLYPWQIIDSCPHSTNHVAFRRSWVRGQSGMQSAALFSLTPTKPSAGKSVVIPPTLTAFLRRSSATWSLALTHLQRCTQAVTVTTRTPLRFGRCPLSQPGSRIPSRKREKPLNL